MTSGQSQVSLRSVSGLSVLTSSDRRSLKYFVLFILILRTPTRPAGDEAELLDSDDEETLQREDVPSHNPFDLSNNF